MANSREFDYSLALKNSIIFYDANKCGKDVETNNEFSWRSACHTSDGSDKGLDLTGGYHDAGDHVKFGLNQGYAAAVLGWALYEFKDTFDATGNTEKLLQQIKHFTDYFLKSHSSSDIFYYQVGDGDVDHSYWGSPENQTNARATMYFADATHPASDILGETSAALSLMYLNYKDKDADYAKQCLQTAKELYQLGKANQGKGNGQSYYTSSDYADDLAWAAVWLYVAVNDAQYLSDAKKFIVLNSTSLQNNWTMTWDSMKLPVILKLGDITGEQTYKDAMEYNFNYWKNTLKTTSGGLKFLSEWGVLRYAAAESMLALVYYKHTKDETLKTLAKSQIDYILGNNPANISYMIGFGDNWPKHPHHRASNGYTYANNDYLKEAKHLLLGALVGGPDANDNFTDDVTKYQYTEVAIDYNAGLVGALAGMVKVSGSTSAVTAEVTAPTEGQSFEYPSKASPITISADASTTSGTISKVAFYANGTKIGESTTSPYSITWYPTGYAQSATGIDSYAITASATDSNGTSAISVPVNIKIKLPIRPEPVGNLTLEAYNGSTAATTNSISPKIKITNSGENGVSLSTVTVRYYYTIDTEKGQSFWCDSAAITSGTYRNITSNVTGSFVKMSTAKSGADYYLEIGFTAAAGSLAAGEAAELQLRFAKNDWSDYTQSNDYSFNSSASTYTDTSKILLYISGQLNIGTEP
jgi:endoglucanase